jgi:hypothetical protein
MTASISRNAFFYGMTQSLGETAIAATLTTARYSVLAWDVATSDEARQTYRWVKEMGIALGQLAFWSTVWAWAKVQQWAEAEVQSCLPTDPDHIPGVGEMVEADPFAPTENQHYPAMAATIAAPVATLVVPVSSPLESMTTAQLRKMAIAHNQGLAKDDPRRIHGAARLTKAQALAALG